MVKWLCRNCFEYVVEELYTGQHDCVGFGLEGWLETLRLMLNAQALQSIRRGEGDAKAGRFVESDAVWGNSREDAPVKEQAGDRGA